MRNVVAGGAADRAGVRENDVIISFNNRTIESADELTVCGAHVQDRREGSVHLLAGRPDLQVHHHAGQRLEASEGVGLHIRSPQHVRGVHEHVQQASGGANS